MMITQPATTGRAKSILAVLALSLALALLTGCASSAGLKEDIAPATESFAEPPATSGLLAELAEDIRNQHGEESSGFKVLDKSFDGLYWRLALIDSATASVDIMTYLWYPDNSGRLLLERAIRAAERGVRVRLIVDDLILHGHDQFIANMNAAPNIEVRMFNPWKNRGSMASRGGEMIAEMERLNTRMHDKLLIADGRAAVVGGRNIGDHYFGLHEAYNFHDTDLFGIGQIAAQANPMFDSFWNSPLVVSADALTTEPDREIARSQRANIQEAIATSEALAAFPREPKDWTQELREYAADLRIGRSKLVYDEVSTEQIDQSMKASMFNFFSAAKQELLIQNAYIIPTQEAVDRLAEMTKQGVRVRMMTNSLASHDVPAVNSHYEGWRDDFLNAGVDLWEFRADPAIQQTVVDVPPIAAKFTGLHSKCAVVDRRYVFIGSMNLDPRSRNINTEMGAFVDSPALAEDLAALLERNMSPQNGWHVQMDSEGEITWVNDEETLTSQPARDGSQRIMNEIFKIAPAEQY